MGYDYYGENGCCLTCEEAQEGCLCYSCKCRKCFNYVPNGYSEGGHCDLAGGSSPEGVVFITIKDKEAVVEIHPYFKPEKFKMIIQILKDWYFRFLPAEKKWVRKCWYSESIQNMIKDFNDLEVNIDYLKDS